MGNAAEPSPEDRRARPAAGGVLTPAERSQVLASATAIFAGYGPAAVTLKWIALSSGVPVDRISIEWSTVDALLAAVLIDVASGVDAVAMARGEGGAEVQRERDRLIDVYERIVARALLDGTNTARLQKTFPSMEHLVELYRTTFVLDERTARYRVAQACALDWGWRLFGPHLLIATGLEDESDEVAGAELQAVQQRLPRLPGVDPA